MPTGFKRLSLMCGKLTINLTTMKKTKTNQQKNEYAKVYYHKHRFTINQKHKQNRQRQETEQKLYKYGFWLLLTAISVNFILTRI